MDMESVTFRSTPHSYGASKNPELGRIAAMLNQCVNLKVITSPSSFFYCAHIFDAGT